MLDEKGVEMWKGKSRLNYRRRFSLRAEVNGFIGVMGPARRDDQRKRIFLKRVAAGHRPSAVNHRDGHSFVPIIGLGAIHSGYN